MIQLNHGWFLVKNRSTKVIKDGVTIAQRHARETTFFGAFPWNKLRKDRVGITPLKLFLGQLLFDHIRDEFPGLVKEVKHLMIETQKCQEELGPARQTLEEQRRFLTRAAMNYQQDLSNALSGVNSANLEPQCPRKLRIHLRNAMDEYAKNMAQKGHFRTFRTVNNDIDWAYMDGTSVDINVPKTANIYDWIRKFYNESKGAELPGTVNPRLLESLF